MNRVARVLAVIALCATAGLAAAEVSPPQVSPEQQLKNLDGKVQSLKKKALDLGREIAILEEELLFPPGTQFAVFLSTSIGADYKLVSAQLKIDDTQVVNYLYSAGEIDALVNGGVQQLYLGNVKTGKHTLNLTYMGKVGKDMTRYSADYGFEKGTNPLYLEINIKVPKAEPGAKPKDPVLSVKEWK